MAILKFLNGLVTSFFGLRPWKSESTSLWPKPRLGFFGFWKKSFLPKKTAKMAIFEPKFHSWPQFSGYNLKNRNQHHFGHYRKTVFFVFGKSHFYLKKQPKWLFLNSWMASWPHFRANNLENWNRHHFDHNLKMDFLVFRKSDFYLKKTAKMAIFELVKGLMTTLLGQ